MNKRHYNKKLLKLDLFGTKNDVKVSNKTTKMDQEIRRLTGRSNKGFLTIKLELGDMKGD